MKYALPLICLLVASAAEAQTVKNPNRAIFVCAPDHDQHTAHELDILRADGTVLQTITLGTAPPDANNEVTLTVNVQPIAFGSYTAKVRAVAGTWKSTDSEPSNVWERVPGQPSKPKVQ